MGLRAILWLWLVLMLSLTSVTAAVARGQMAGSADMVICAGGTEATVTLDAFGRAMVRHPCPDCTAAGHALLAVPAKLVPVAGRQAVALLPASGKAKPDLAGIAPVARGPPLAG